MDGGPAIAKKLYFLTRTHVTKLLVEGPLRFSFESNKRLGSDHTDLCSDLPCCCCFNKCLFLVSYLLRTKKFHSICHQQWTTERPNYDDRRVLGDNLQRNQRHQRQDSRPPPQRTLWPWQRMNWNLTIKSISPFPSKSAEGLKGPILVCCARQEGMGANATKAWDTLNHASSLVECTL